MSLQWLGGTCIDAMRPQLVRQTLIAWEVAEPHGGRDERAAVRARESLLVTVRKSLPVGVIRVIAVSLL